MATANYDTTELEQLGLPFPPGWDPAVMPELQAESPDRPPKPFPEVARDVKDHYDTVYKFMDQYRQRHETRWRLAREYYNQAEAQKYDKDRLTSIFEKRPLNDNTRQMEYDPARWALLMPIVFEAVQQLQSRLYSALFGDGPDYIEIQGREKNDVPQARVYEDVCNYQMGYLNDTTRHGMDWINTAVVEGTGVLVKTWDFQRNCPKDDVVDPLDYWFDPLHGDMQRWNMWRRRITVGDLQRLKAAGQVWFAQEDLESAVENPV